MKYTVQAVILNDKKEVLAVSRKNDHTDFGLVGGKVDEEDLNPLEAMARETFEETGLRINTATMQVVFQMHRDNHMGITYLIKQWSGEIHTDEPHIVKWVPFEVVMDGSFGFWNEMVFSSLKSMGVEVKESPDPEDKYYFAIGDANGMSDYPHVWVVSKTFWDENGHISDSMKQNEYEDISRMCANSSVHLSEAMESYFEVSDNTKIITDEAEIERLMIESGFEKKEEIA